MSENRLNPNPSGITFYGADWCPDCRRSKRWLTENNVPFEFFDVDADPESSEFVKKVNNGSRSIPTILFPGGAKLVEPSNEELAAHAGK